MQLHEFTRLEGTVEDSNVFRGVKILGLKSQNGYSYDPAAVAKAAPLYQGSPVFIDHKKGNRSYSERIGYIENPRLQEHELYGDFVLNPRHALAEQVLWDAEHGTSGVGFSHSVDGTMNKAKNLVESIDKVFSVDLVAGPATVKSLFESVQVEEQKHVEQANQLEELKKASDSLTQQLAEVVRQVAELQTATKKKPVALLPQTQEEPVKDRYADFFTSITRITK